MLKFLFYIVELVFKNARGILIQCLLIFCSGNLAEWSKASRSGRDQHCWRGFKSHSYQIFSSKISIKKY
jgi:hypothetical protein